MAEAIYGKSVSHLKGKIVHHKDHHVEPIIGPNFLKGVFDRNNKVNLCCDLNHINGIGFLNTLSWHILSSTGSTIKIQKLKNI